MDLVQYLVSSVKIMLKLAVLLSRIKWVSSAFEFVIENCLCFLFAAIVKGHLLFFFFAICRFSSRLPEKEVSLLLWQSLMESLGLDSRRFQ